MLDITITDSRQTAILEERETFICWKKIKKKVVGEWDLIKLRDSASL